MPVQFRCADVGVSCKTVSTAANADDLVAKVAAHVSKVHHVELTQTLIDYAVTKVTETSE